MKKLLIVALLMMTVLSIFGQTTVTIGTGTSAQSYPFNIYYGFSRCAALYTNADLAANTGNITSLAWYVNAAQAINAPVKIYMKSTTATTAASGTWASYLTDATLVYDGTLQFTPVGWFTINLTTPFAFSGNNLLVLTEGNYTGGGTASYPTFRYTSVTNTCAKAQADNTAPASVTMSATRPNIQVTFAPAAGTDLALLGVSSPVATGEYTASETVTYQIKNVGTTSFDFSTNNVTLNASVTGPNPTTFDAVVVSSGTLDASATLDVRVSTGYNMTTAGTYTFGGTITLNEDTSANNTLAGVTRTKIDPVAIPFSQDFSAGLTLPAGWTSDMSVNATHGNTANGLTKNIYGTILSCYAQLPKLGPLASNSTLKFDYRIVDYSSYPATGTTLTATEIFTVKLSTDAGATFSPIYVIDQSNHVTSNAWATVSVDLGAYEGLNGIVRIEGVQAAGDFYFDLDNFQVINVSSDPQFSINATSHDFGSVAVNGVGTLFNITVQNLGMSALNITSVALGGVDAGQFTLTDANTYPVNLAQNQSMTFSANFAPRSAGTKNATITVIDDFGKASHEVTLTGLAIDYNYGGGDPASVYGGYYYSNSTTADAAHPVFSWANTTTNELVATVINGTIDDPTYPHSGTTDDGYWGPIDLGFTFNYFGVDYTQCFVTTNGLITFGVGETGFTNALIPAAVNPNAMIAPFWDDMEYYPAATHIYFGNSGSNFVVTWDHLGYTGSALAEYVTFQAILMPNGAIKFQYLQKSDLAALNACTVGLENATGDKGVNYLFNGTGGPLFPVAKAGEIAIMFGTDPGTLPVTLAYFNANFMSVENGFVQLSWRTESETDNQGFNLYRATEPIMANAEKINPYMIVDGIAEGSATTYTQKDAEVESDATYYYWLENVNIDNTNSFFGPIEVKTGTITTPPPAELKTTLNNAYPNPFNPSTFINYSVKEAGNVSINIYNIKGEKVRTLVNGQQNAGSYRLEWNGKDHNGKTVGTGVYFYKMTAGKYTSIKKMMMLK